MQQHSGREPFADAKQAANILLFVLIAMSMVLEVFARRRFGPRYFGLPTLAALLGLPFWTVFWPQEDARPMLVFWALFVLMLLLARIGSAWSWRRGVVFHSRYDGPPWLALVFRRTPEWMLKSWHEPLLAFLAGTLLSAVSLPVGSFVMCAALAMGLSQSLARSIHHARALDMHDHLIEQQMHLERFQALRDRSRW